MPFLLLTISLKSQERLQDSSYLSWFDRQVGIENTALYEGVVYKENYRTINDQIKFYKSAKWLSGSVVYSGQLFSNILLKYDVYADQLIIKQLDRLGGGAVILFKDKISSFTIDGTEFVHIKTSSINASLEGFYELLSSGSDKRLLGGHQKRNFLKKDRSFLYHEFKDLQKKYVLELGGEYYELKSKKDLIEVFPELKKEIDLFYKKNRRIRDKDTDTFMKTLFNRLDDLLISSTINTLE
ncbi:MAG: hypothetical protein ACR2MM_07630 [Flavobacteriaceae bacterium]